MIGAIVNTGAIVVGGLCGMVFGRLLAGSDTSRR